ncbi:MAG: hypothetical protein QXT19_02970 [Candidatus Woesearchaeota archaeon]
MFGLDNKEIKSVDDFFNRMDFPAVIDSQVSSVVLEEAEKNTINADAISDLWNYFISQVKAFVKYHKALEKPGITMAVGFDRESKTIGVLYAKSLYDAYQKIEDSFNGIVFLREFNYFMPGVGYIDRAGVVYTGKPQRKDSGEHTKVLPAIA